MKLLFHLFDRLSVLERETTVKHCSCLNINRQKFLNYWWQKQIVFFGGIFFDSTKS